MKFEQLKVGDFFFFTNELESLEQLKLKTHEDRCRYASCPDPSNIHCYPHELVIKQKLTCTPVPEPKLTFGDLKCGDKFLWKNEAGHILPLLVKTKIKFDLGPGYFISAENYASCWLDCLEEVVMAN